MDNKYEFLRILLFSCFSSANFINKQGERHFYKTFQQDMQFEICYDEKKCIIFLKFVINRAFWLFDKQRKDCKLRM